MRKCSEWLGLVAVASVLASSPLPLLGQSSARGAVRGIAYDSLHARPLAGAMVSIGGTARTATTDSTGRFAFDSLAPGTYTFSLFHSDIDSLGFADLSERISLRGPNDTVALAIPTFAALWQNACGARPVPVDSGFIFGTVRDPDGSPAGNARVTLAFMTVTLESSAGARQRRGHGETHTDSNGAFVFCGVPTDVNLQLVADRVANDRVANDRVANDRATGGGDSLSTDVLDLSVNHERVRRQDLRLGETGTKGVATGVVRGTIRFRESGTAAVGVRVLAIGAKEVRTGSGGTFALNDVPTGTRQIEVVAVGMQPVSRIVQVQQSATTQVEIILDNVTTLDTREVTASRSVRATRIADMERRRELGLGKYADSTVVAKQYRLLEVIRMLDNKHLCALVYIDGMPQRGRGILDVINSVDSHSIAMLEIVRYEATPMAWRPNVLCNTLLLWTKDGLP